ncbi:MAG: tannase/feruloyl esterase family alpha/beta hydrolase [Caulobacterales bacterium]
MIRLWAAAGCALSISLAAAPAARAETPCESLASTVLPHASVLEAVPGPAEDHACRVRVASHPTSDSDIRIEVWIPSGGAWNGRYVQLGNGGFAGSIPAAYLALLAAHGYAVAATDDGHQGAPTDASWALGHTDKVTDFGWRALKETTDTARALIVAMKGAGARRSYFLGCSDGGREALMEAQRFPDDFDGIIAGAPANDFTGLFALGAVTEQILLETPGAYLGPTQLRLLENGALAACGGSGGGADSYVLDPLACKFDPGVLVCESGQDPGRCLTYEQAATARAVYRGLASVDGKPLYPGYTPGAEAEPGGWQAWITGPSRAQAGEATTFKFATEFFGDFAYGDAGYDIRNFDVADLPRITASIGSILNSIDPDLRKFRDHGGKLIQYHGWNDAAIPARGSIKYYESVSAVMTDPSKFYRLYLIPGMLHCGGGPGPGNVDWIAVLQDWVERGLAPADLTAVSGPIGQPAARGATQLICPYPQRPTATGPESRRCLLPPPPPRRGA